MLQTPHRGFLRAADPAVLTLRGDDAGEFLNGQVSNDVAALADGDSRYALLLTPKGKLQSDMTIVRDGDETHVVTSREHLPLINKTIETYRIGWQFSVEDTSEDWALVQLVGVDEAPRTGAAVVELASPLGLDLLVDRSELPLLLSALAEADLAELTPEQLDAARVAAGVPVFGAELDENTFPAEAGLEERAVSFEKGCYVGQETVARMHYKGKPNRHLRLLRSAAPLQRGAEVTAADGRRLGVVGTTAVGEDGSQLALAVLRREGEPGNAVDAGGTEATIVEIVTADAR